MNLLQQGRPEGVDAAPAQIIVEVLKLRRQGNRLDPEARCSGEQAVACAVSGRIAIAEDLEPAERRRKQDSGEVRGRERRHHGHVGHDLTGRQHGLDALAGCQHLIRDAEPDAVPEKVSHRPSR